MGNIVIILPEINIGGAEKVVIDLCCEYIKMKIKVCLVVLRENKGNHFNKLLEESNVEVRYIGFKPGHKILNYIKLNKCLKEIAPNIVHINIEYKNSIIWALFHKVKTVITIHTQPYRMDNFINRRLFQLISLKKSSIFIGVSAIISKEMAEVFKIKQEKVKTIYNPICLDKDIIYNPNKGTKIMLAHVGRFHPVKDHDLLIDSFFLAHKEDPNLILNLFGDGEMKEIIQRKVEKLGIMGKVVFWGNCPNIKEQLKNMDIFILTSFSEAMPISVLEAMSVGLPVITANVGGVKELVDNNGILVHSREPGDFAKAIIKLSGNKELRECYSKVALNKIKKFDVKEIAKQYLMVYQ